MTCVINHGDGVMEWREYVTDKVNGRRIYDSGSGDVMDDEHYDVIRKGSQEYELVIKGVTKDLVGEYGCGIVGTQIQANASLVAVGMYRTLLMQLVQYYIFLSCKQL